MDTETQTSPPATRPHNSRNRRLALTLREIFDELPEPLAGSDIAQFPLLEAVRALDLHAHTDIARRLVLLAVEVHSVADERRVAEFLLRNRRRATSPTATATLIACARCTADLDDRYARWRETPMDAVELRSMEAVARPPADDGGSVADLVLDRVEDVLAEQLDESVRRVIGEAVVSFMALAERHALNTGTEISLVAMRPAARKPARLITSLRQHIEDEVLARRVARLLIGADGTPAETAFLWWVGGPHREQIRHRADLVVRWRRDLHVIADRCATLRMSYAA